MQSLSEEKLNKKAKQLYFSCMFDDSVYQDFFTKEKKPMPAANKYHILMCRGLRDNGVKVLSYSQLPATMENCGKRFVKRNTYDEKDFRIKYFSFPNIPIFKHLALFIKSFFVTVTVKTQLPILLDVLPVSMAMGVVLGAKVGHKKTVGIVTDLPEYMPIANNEKMLKINNKILNMCDAYVLLTDAMNDKVNSRNKPYIVLEGHADVSMLQTQVKENKDDKKVVLYAGGLQKAYGIEKLCNAFIKCHKQNEELHVYGDGEYAEELKKLCETHSEIKYFGNCPNKVVVEDELSATLLVNPRPAEGEFTKYSFPSKTMEYMASGTPVLMTRLPGIPKEYYQYTYCFEDESENGFALKIREVLDIPRGELFRKGNSAKNYILSCKSNVAQSRKVLDFIRGL